MTTQRKTQKKKKPVSWEKKVYPNVYPGGIVVAAGEGQSSSLSVVDMGKQSNENYQKNAEVIHQWMQENLPGGTFDHLIKLMTPQPPIKNYWGMGVPNLGLIWGSAVPLTKDKT